MFATNEVDDATNRELLLPSSGRVDRGEPVVDVPVPGGGGESKTSNRRTREAYNAYQRDYMKKRRAEKILKISGEKS